MIARKITYHWQPLRYGWRLWFYPMHLFGESHYTLHLGPIIIAVRPKK